MESPKLIGRELKKDKKIFIPYNTGPVILDTFDGDVGESLTFDQSIMTKYKTMEQEGTPG